MGAAAASPVPGRANRGLVEQSYKYLPLRDPVTQPRSCKGKRCPPAGLGASVPAQPLESPHVLVHGQGTGVQSSEVTGTAVCGSCGQAQAAFLPRAQREASAGPIDPPSTPQPPPALLYKHNPAKSTSYSTTNALHETPTPTYTFTPSCCSPGTLHPLTQMQILQPVCTIKPAVGRLWGQKPLRRGDGCNPCSLQSPQP